ncbi:ribonuclease P protein component [Propionibacterium australiense]|uniref:Ribonuclease P protein component n=1 Tax=Propionibacterium australiense TaxID=119981 RepID=A0A8B3FKU1_9ACTN|nr:ribonuclease P protein component [Propionibacterium australiense]RLP08531.1 ribonuclease P protein component [Propionibacterium australiense]RLP08600.1 ribonuclease P protein component [Propionibacterium australiense]
MLPAQARLRRSEDFKATVRHGVRVGRPTIVVHAGLADHVAHGDDVVSAQVGFVVSRKVGNAVTRNRVKRRLRHMAAAQLRQGVRPDLRVVVRALPASATQPGRLAGDFRSAWCKSVERLEAGA